MKKRLAAVLAATLLGLGAIATTATPDAQAGDDDVAALMLSMYMPGAGEWYNSGFSGGFPLVECILGTICPCVRIASIVDSAAGKTDDGIRFDFWSSPN